MSRALDRADRIEETLISTTASLYDRSVAAVIRKHGNTLRQMRQMEQKGEYARMRVFARTSGLLNDLANAIASAGKDSAAAIRTALADVREVMADDDGGAA